MNAATPAIRFDPRRPPTLEQVEQALSGTPGDPELLRRRASIRLDRGDLAAATASRRNRSATTLGQSPRRMRKSSAKSLLSMSLKICSASS